jgi:hypothetical protein
MNCAQDARVFRARDYRQIARIAFYSLLSQPREGDGFEIVAIYTESVSGL